MRLTRLSLTVGRTINLGNYENLRLEATAEATVDATDLIEEVRGFLIAECRASISSAYDTHNRKKKEMASRPDGSALKPQSSTGSDPAGKDGEAASERASRVGEAGHGGESTLPFARSPELENKR